MPRFPIAEEFSYKPHDTKATDRAIDDGRQEPTSAEGISHEAVILYSFRVMRPYMAETVKRRELGCLAGSKQGKVTLQQILA